MNYSELFTGYCEHEFSLSSIAVILVVVVVVEGKKGER